jgi:signal transduction histidine kinase
MSWSSRLPTWMRTARFRLTAFYAGTFFILGTIVVLVIFTLASTTTAVMASAAHPAPGSFVPHALVQQVTGLQQNADLKRLLAGSWLVLAVTAGAAAGLGWFASGRVLRPVREMTAAARTISAGNLGQRLAVSGPDDEFKRLGDTFDELLARLESSFEAQRRFVSNASHELRTPLTVERTLLQVALADPNASADTLRATCEELLASGRDQERLLESLLTLASSERGLDRSEPLDLANLVSLVLRAPRPEVEGLGLQVDAALAPAAMRGERALVERLVANLIDNAVSYNMAGGRIAVNTISVDGRAVFSITNTGPVVPSAEIERLYEPFQRMGGRISEPGGHHGLGLSIVRAIALAHGATLNATPQAEGGLSVTVSFPA